MAIDVLHHADIVYPLSVGAGIRSCRTHVQALLHRGPSSRHFGETVKRVLFAQNKRVSRAVAIMDIAITKSSRGGEPSLIVSLVCIYSDNGDKIDSD